jgi:hypothetical protein
MTKKTKKNTKKEQKPKATLEATEVEVVEEDDLLPYNPLVQKPIVPITPEEEAEQKIQLIEETESLVELNEQNLKAKQRQAKLEIELKKIKTAKDLTKAMEDLIDIGVSQEVLNRVVDNIKTPFDLKHFSDALKNFNETRDKNMESLINDEFGRRRKTKIMAAFRTRAGEEMMLSAELPDNK